MIKELVDNIRTEVFNKLDSIFNYRKDKEGLVSLHNSLIIDLKKQ